MGQRASPLAGFWMGGYEGADHVNGHGQPLDMARASGHIDRLDEDHRRAAQAGLQCVRESIGWRLAESAGGAIDLSRALRIQASAARHGLQPVWTLMHYGLPPDLSLHDDAMVPRLVRFAREVARVLGQGSSRPPVYNVVNEISFLAWAAAHSALLFAPNGPPTAEALARPPHGAPARSTGYEVKRRLARAALLAMRAMREEDPRARFINVEPLVHVVAPPDRPDLQPQADLERGWQWQAFDMLSGRLEPELGGGPEWLDLVGVNYYHMGQWEVQTGEPLHWHRRDPRRLPLHRLLHETWQRYPGPLVVAETSHVGVGRAAWLHEVAAEVRTARRQGVPVQGLCLYPLVDRPDWQEPTQWHRSGVWHVDPAPAVAVGGQGTHDRGARVLQRHAEPAVHAALRQWQRHLPQHSADTAGGTPPAPLPVLLAYAPGIGGAGRGSAQRWRERLARRFPDHRVVVVDVGAGREPSAHGAWLDHRPCGPRLDLLVLHGFGPHDAIDRTARMAAAVAGWMSSQGLHRHVAWLDTPAAWPLAQSLQPQQVLHAPAAAAGPGQRCDATLAFFRRGSARTGGWALSEARALMPSASGPVLGFAGSIDARLDLPLLAALADARRDWQWVMVGPLQGIDPAALPRAANLHWLGEQPYELLPALMSQWQLCMLPRRPAASVKNGAMPSAMAEALAAGLAVVTSLPWSPAWPQAGVHPAAGLTGFVAACEQVLAQPFVGRPMRRQRSAALAERLLRDLQGVRAPALAEEMP